MGEEMKRNVGNVAKYNTDKVKIALQTKLHAISVIKQAIGLVSRNSKPVNKVTEQENKPYFLGFVHNAKEAAKQWMVRLHLDSFPVEFKIDTESDVNTINEDSSFNIFIIAREPSPLDTPLDSLGGELQCLGILKATVKTYPITAHVIRGDTVNKLLSHDLLMETNLLRGVDKVRQYASGWYQACGAHGKVTTDPVKILLKDDAQPYAEHTVCQMPLPMLQSQTWAAKNGTMA